MQATCMESGRIAWRLQTTSGVSFPVDADWRVFDAELRLQFVLNLANHNSNIGPPPMSAPEALPERDWKSVTRHGCG